MNGAAKSQIGLCQCSPCLSLGVYWQGRHRRSLTIYEGHWTALYCTGTRDVVLCLYGPGPECSGTVLYRTSTRKDYIVT